MITKRFIVLTLYPEMFDSFLSTGLLGKAIAEERIQVELVNYRSRGIGRHHSVDDTPYGGGAGMVLRVEPIAWTLKELDQKPTRKILLSPRGEPFRQEKARELADDGSSIALICGRFEGFDERVRTYVDEEISLGDYIMMGGEVGAMAIIESVGRLIPGVIGNSESLKTESFSQDLLEYAQYTKPVEFEGQRVPEVLMSGNHQKIEEWREMDAIRKTRENRGDIYRRHLEKER